MKKDILIQHIEKYAPLSLQAEWDFSGTQIESIKDDFKHLAVMLDPSYHNIKQAIACGADCILTHHPLSLSEYRLNKKNTFFALVQMLLSQNILLYSAHTSLDSRFMGFSSWLAEDLQLQELEELDKEGHFGCVGSLEKPISLSSLFTKLLQSMPFMKKSDFRLVGQCEEQDIKRTIQKIAFCTGSASSLYELAKAQNTDIFITGDTKYHFALDIATDSSFEKAPLLLDVGHFSLEEEMMRRFAKTLAQTLDRADIEVGFISGINPFISFSSF